MERKWKHQQLAVIDLMTLCLHIKGIWPGRYLASFQTCGFSCISIVIDLSPLLPSLSLSFFPLAPLHHFYWPFQRQVLVQTFLNERDFLRGDSWQHICFLCVRFLRRVLNLHYKEYQANSLRESSFDWLVSLVVLWTRPQMQSEKRTRHFWQHVASAPPRCQWNTVSIKITVWNRQSVWLTASRKNWTPALAKGVSVTGCYSQAYGKPI